MGRLYSGVFSAIAATAAQDLFEVNAPADAIVKIHGIWISNNTDETSQQLRITIERSTGSSGSGGASVTPNPFQVGDPAFGGTVERNNTTRATTLTVLVDDSFNVLNGWMWIPTPEMQITISPSGRLVVGLPNAPGASITLSGTIVFEEIGG